MERHLAKEITKARADEINAAWDAATSTQRLSMPRIQWFSVGGDTTYYETTPSQLELAAAARIAELEAALDEINAASFREDRTRENTVMVPIGAWDNAMRVIARS